MELKIWLDYFFAPERMFLYFNRVAGIFLFVLIIFIIYKLILISLDKTLKAYGDKRKLIIIVSLVKNILRYAAFFIIVVSVLQQIGINVTAVLASAGILGLAVSFGAQNLVKDIIAGFFIVLENQYTIGEEIQVFGVKGKVENMSLRMTTLRDENNVVYTIPNGSISMVHNFSRK